MASPYPEYIRQLYVGLDHEIQAFAKHTHTLAVSAADRATYQSIRASARRIQDSLDRILQNGPIGGFPSIAKFQQARNRWNTFLLVLDSYISALESGDEPKLARMDAAFISTFRAAMTAVNDMINDWRDAMGQMRS